VKTLNGFGYAVCRKNVKRYIKIDADKVEKTLRFDCLDGAKSGESKDLFYKTRFLISKIIAIWKADMVWHPGIDNMFEVMDRFNLDMPKRVGEQQL
jgi:hypothetical protein